jgi:hypothetical protein
MPQDPSKAFFIHGPDGERIYGSTPEEPIEKARKLVVKASHSSPWHGLQIPLYPQPPPPMRFPVSGIEQNLDRNPAKPEPFKLYRTECRRCKTYELILKDAQVYISHLENRSLWLRVKDWFRGF